MPIDVLHIDLTRCPSQLEDILKTNFVKSSTILSLGVVDGRNIWKNDYKKSVAFIRQAMEKLGEARVWIAPSCSLLHVPCDLEEETKLNPEIKNWMAFAKQKLHELSDLSIIIGGIESGNVVEIYSKNQEDIAGRISSKLIHNNEVKIKLAAITPDDFERKSAFKIRQEIQTKVLNLPLMPTTTIGSFPQTEQVRIMRAKFKKGEISNQEYKKFIEQETLESVRFQEETGIDVLVHGEYERNDMVEYFGELLEGFAFTENGWVQSYGSRCVKPPVIFGDIARKAPMTVRWTTYAQSLTPKWMKGMLTGPVTMLQWSFVRDDQSRKTTCMQLALAIREEVLDLEKAGIKIIQIDEPAIREGLPLRKEDWGLYLAWAVDSFRLAAAGVKDAT